MPTRDNYCFACGQDNPFGLKLDFSMEKGKCTAKKRLSKEYQGYNGIVHGGILAAMVDESMAKYLILNGFDGAVTAKLEMRYHKPTPIGETLTVSAWEESRRQNFVLMKGTVSLPDGTITAEGKGQMAITENASP